MSLTNHYPAQVVANLRHLLAPRWRDLPLQTVVVCNRKELEQSCRPSGAMEPCSSLPLKDRVRQVWEQLGVQALVVTDGDHPVWACTQGDVWQTPVPLVCARPQGIGAGDLFSAVLLYGLLCDDSLAVCVRVAVSACSNYVAQPRGRKLGIRELQSVIHRYTIARMRVQTADFRSQCCADRKTVFTQGAFDLLHDGHRQLLSHCVRNPLEEVLVVAVNSDESVRRSRGADRPVRSLSQRLLDVAYNIPADVTAFVVPFEGHVGQFLDSLEQRPDSIVRGSEYAKGATDGQPEYGVTLRCVEMLRDESSAVLSTTRLLRK